MRVLIVEDNTPLAAACREGLQEAGFAVDLALNGEDGDLKGRSTQYDLVVLDITLPKKDGLTLLRDWREDGIEVPVVAISGRGSLADKLAGLNTGADDYLVKPFEMDELVARSRAAVRRGYGVRNPVLKTHDLEIHTASRLVRRGGRSIHLAPREYNILELLAVNRGRVVTRTDIWEHLYDEFDDNKSNVLDVAVSLLREKIDKGFDPPLIVTRYGLGYRLRQDGEDEKK